MILIPISIGELFDKISILQIKQSEIQDKEKLEKVNAELGELLKVYDSIKREDSEHLMQNLIEINQKLWHLENKIRKLIREERFDEEYVETSVKIHKFNDERFGVKNEINVRYGSEVVEVKEHNI